MKIGICVPHYADVKAQFADSLAGLLIHSLTAPICGPDGLIKLQVERFFHESSVLPWARHEVIRRAIEWGAEWLLLLDADQTFPPDTLLRLLAHGRPVVGCNYERRDGSGPVVARGSGPQEVDHLGLGVFLLNRHVLGAMTEQASKEGRDTLFPLFMITLAEHGQGYIGEDVFFCRKLRAAGFPVLCDHDLSLEIGHVSEVVRKGGASANPVPPSSRNSERR